MISHTFRGYMKNFKIIALLFSIFTLPFLLSCEDKDDNKLAGAQECLDKLKDSDSNAMAQACENKVNGLTSAESYVIRCSTRFFIGGVKSSNIAAAYNSYNTAAAANKAAVLMYTLSQTDQTAAQATYNACKLANVPSLDYIATASLTGTIIKHGGAGTTGNIATDLAKCDAGGLGGVCDDAAIGTALVAMSSNYCVGEKTSEQVCTEIRSAIDAAGGTSNPALIAISLYNLIAN